MEHERFDYQNAALDVQALAKDPVEQLMRWLSDAGASDALEPNAMALATATPDGAPSCRMVLLRGLDERGLVFFTNYESRKAGELEANQAAAACFFWWSLMRQVRVEGVVERVAQEESESYFASRPLENQAASAFSPQSRVVETLEPIEAKIQAAKAAYPTRVKRPKWWGGYVLKPHAFEFWQGRPARLHDRFRYRPEGGAWVIERLAP